MEAVAFFKFPTISYRLDSWAEAKKSFKNQLLQVAKRCGVFRQPIHKSSLSSNRQLSVHVVQGGETLTSISKKYGVSIYAIAAANFDIVDLDLVLEGQHLYIPIGFQKDIAIGSKQIYRYTLDKYKSFLNVHLIPESQKFIGTVTSYSSLASESKQIYRSTLGRCRGFLDTHMVPQSQKFISTVTPYSPPTVGKWTGYYLFFVPLFAFCIMYMIKAFQARNRNLLKQRRVEKDDLSESRNSRWRKVLDDEVMNNSCDTISTEESINPSKEEKELPFEEMCSAYTKLEPAYTRFLEDCGMSKCGYWRGGAPD